MHVSVVEIFSDFRLIYINLYPTFFLSNVYVNIFPFCQSDVYSRLSPNGQIINAVSRHNSQFLLPKFVPCSQSHIKGDHKCCKNAIPDNGPTFVAKRQVHSRHYSQDTYFH